jgi:hypothetical protein
MEWGLPLRRTGQYALRHRWEESAARLRVNRIHDPSPDRPAAHLAPQTRSNAQPMLDPRAPSPIALSDSEQGLG